MPPEEQKAAREEMRRLRLTAGVSEDRYAMLCGLFRVREKSYRRNETVFPSGATATVFGAIVGGRVQSVGYDALGNRKIIAEYHERECFAVTNVGADSDRYSFDYVASEDSTILLFDVADVFRGDGRFSADDRLLAAGLLFEEATRQARQYERHLSVMHGKTLRDKLMIFFSGLIRETGSGTFSLSFSRQELADYLCVDRSALCRELSAMKKQGLLECSGKRFRFNNTMEGV